MILDTDRIVLTPISISDLQAIHELHSRPETDKYNTLGIPESIDTTRSVVNDWLEKQNTIPQTSYIFSLSLKKTKVFIGLLALNLGKATSKSGEVWYKIHKGYWNQGHTTEALQRLLHFAFTDLGLHRIEAGCSVENIASIKVLEKCGMTREGRSRKILPIRGEWVDNYLYAILEEDLEKI